MSHFSEKISVKVDEEKKKVNLSIRVSDTMVSVITLSVKDFERAVASFKTQLKG